MFGFNDFLLEMAAFSSSEASDDKGKLHELLLSKHLHSKKRLPEHHRSESDDYGGTPQQVHDRLQQKMNPNSYKEIDSHAKQNSEAIRKYIKNNPEFNGHDISNIHWTSNRDTVKKSGDHEKTTGIRDPNANADLIVTLRHPKTGAIKHVGVSAKYGTEVQPNYRNDGLAALEQKGGLKPGTLTDIQKAHDQDMADRLGYTGTKKERHAQYKIGRKLKGEERAAWKEKTGSNKGFIPKKKESKRARDAEDASVLARKKMARHLDAGLGNMNDDQLRNFIRGQVSPPTKIHHIVAHSQVQDDGSAVSHVGDMSRIADTHLDNFQNLRVKKGNGIYTQIVGDYRGKERPVAQQILKTGSGPVKGSAGAFKLVSIPKKIQTVTEPATKIEKPTAKLVKPKPSRKISPEGIPEHMPQAHRDTESYMGFKQ
jgi:transposase